jgi:hypothetical protein
MGMFMIRKTGEFTVMATQFKSAFSKRRSQDFWSGGAAKNPGGAKKFSGAQHFKSPPIDNFFGKKIFRTITLQLLS